MLVVLAGKHATFEDNGRSCSNQSPFSTSSHLLPPHPTPFHPPLPLHVREKLAQGSVEEIADPRMGPIPPDAPPDALQRILDLAIRCTATFTADRPSMGRIAQEMEALRSEVCGGEEKVHKSHKVVDAELKERMQEQRQFSETMVSVLASMNSGSIGSVSSLWNTREPGKTGDMSGTGVPLPDV
ncbi:unnamed protein product [Closterium sp. Naga37s-1]|nr:unnamed protein product [Closterium sp. Naga37s-1]